MHDKYQHLREALGKHTTAKEHLRRWQHIQRFDSDWRDPVTVQQKLDEARANVTVAETRIAEICGRIKAAADAAAGDGTLRIPAVACSL